MPCPRRALPHTALAAALACNAIRNQPEDTDATSSSSTSLSSTDSPTTLGTTGDDACPKAELSAEIMACTPPGITAVWWFLDVSWDSDEQCTVTAVQILDETQVIDLDCPAVANKLNLTTSAPHVELAIDVGTEVRVQYWSVNNGEVQSGYFALRRVSDGALLAAGVNAPIEHVEIAPLQIDLRSTTCELWGDACSTTQRGAIELVSGADSVTVFDGNASTLGEFTVLAGVAIREHCSDFGGTCASNYENWGMQALILRAP